MIGRVRTGSGSGGDRMASVALFSISSFQASHESIDDERFALPKLTYTKCPNQRDHDTGYISSVAIFTLSNQYLE